MVHAVYLTAIVILKPVYTDVIFNTDVVRRARASLLMNDFATNQQLSKAPCLWKCDREVNNGARSVLDSNRYFETSVHRCKFQYRCYGESTCITSD